MKKTIYVIVIFLIIMIIPFAVNIGNASPAPEPSLDTPAINAMSEKVCIEDTDFMRSHHMQMLVEWRDETVRDGARQYVSTSGQVYEKSLDDTCLVCHSNPEQFCDTCHTYANVEINCWDCHEKVNAGSTSEGK